MNEVLVESGIVIKSGNGIAEIRLNKNESCEECSAKIFCSPGENNLRTITVSDSIGTLPGDKVNIAIRGIEVLKVSVLLYGIPLILIIAGILAGMFLLKDSNHKEIYSFLSGLLLTGLYYTFLYFKFSMTKKLKPLSKIITSCRSEII